MEQAIDRFIWQDDDREEAPPPDPDTKRATDDVPEIVARLAPRPRQVSEALPRIVVGSQPVPPAPQQPGDGWRRQFITALHDADDAAPIIPLNPKPQMSRPLDATVPATPAARTSLDPAPEPSDPAPSLPGWRSARQAIIGAAVAACLLSTGALWSSHRAAMVSEAVGRQLVTAALSPESKPEPEPAIERPIWTTPVLVREGEAQTPVPETAAPSPSQPEPPPTVPSVAPAAPSPSAPPPSAPSHWYLPSMTDRAAPVLAAPAAEAAAAADTRPATPRAVDPIPARPALDRNGLTDVAVRSVATHEIVPARRAAADPPRREAAVPQQRVHDVPPVAASPGKRSSRQPAYRNGAKQSKSARARVPATSGWEMQRQSLRTQPEPEPSTLQKLIKLVWPGSSTAATEAKPAPPAQAVPAYSWSGGSRARP